MMTTQTSVFWLNTVLPHDAKHRGRCQLFGAVSKFID